MYTVTSIAIIEEAPIGGTLGLGLQSDLFTQSAPLFGSLVLWVHDPTGLLTGYR